MADRSEAAVVRDQVRLQNEPLSIDVAHTLVAHPAAGAIATFTGTTRDNFDGKRVVTLEYEAYGPMALSEMRKLCAKGRAEYPSVMRVALFHRLGPVAIGESSVITAVSSPHRADALACCQFLINELKATVPIWKKEVYEDGSKWKENAEFWRSI